MGGRYFAENAEKTKRMAEIVANGVPGLVTGSG